MNEHLADPVLRSFRQPVHLRLRAKIDELHAVIDAQAKAIAKQGKENAELQRLLRRRDKELAALSVRTRRAERLAMNGGGNTAGTLDAQGSRT